MKADTASSWCASKVLSCPKLIKFLESLLVPAVRLIMVFGLIDMNKVPQILKSKTEKVVNELAVIKGIKAILCFGSYAFGTFDQYSDIDLYIFCHPDIISSIERRKVLQKIKDVTNFQPDYLNFRWDDQWCTTGDLFRINEIQFDIVYNTIKWINTVVSKVKNQGATSIPELKFRPYTMLGLIDNSIILYDPESRLERIKSNLYPYPSELKKVLLSQSLLAIRESLEDLREYIKRDIGNTAFHFHLEKIIESFGTFLFAVNEKYDPATKRMEEAYGKLKLIPDCFLQRYKKLLETPLTKNGRKVIVSEIEFLIKEIEQLT